ncbi:aldo/keto reductase [Brevundimonas guildfordensis]|uniref:Aldo/keto reductase n=1 Tax=Brevundimonas guildfordensis TaxID=2762241 RepID=A0ABR8R2N8_9CAUL|nr:aldo/keto reductase [Brevundimonas guildfordensis]MBD7942047.1 aldo/keto reductase [Brevundimonas guildfordensis]
MRYRPFGLSGGAVSNLTLCLGSEATKRGAEHVRQMIFAALEAGINAYHFDNADPALLKAAGEALGHVERRLVIASVGLGVGRDFSPIGLEREIEQGLHASGLGWFDLAVLDRPGENELPQAALTTLKAIRKAGHVRMLGVSGDEAVSDLYVSTGAFDALFTPFHANIEWRVRARMRAALERQMSLFVYGYFPDSLSTERKAAEAGAPKKRGLFGLGGRAPVEETQRGSFAFLHQTRGWTAEAICLAYALTDPGVSSALIRPRDRTELEALAGTPERDLPAGLSAQIEMARVDALV